MKSTAVLLGSILASAALAQPHHQRHQHQHAARHQKEKRDQSVVWVTDWVYETETVDLTTTIWVTPGFVPPSASPTTTSAAASSSSGDAGQFFETPAAQVVQSPTPQTTSTSVYVAPPPSSTYVAPSSSEAAPAYIPPVEISTSVDPPAYVAPVESSTSVPQPTTTPEPVETPTTTPEPVNLPAPATTAAPTPTTTAASSGSYSGVCDSGSPCSGDITWYDVGLGACGWTNVDSDKVVALPHELMGTQSNGNPYCGKTITVEYGGSSVICTVSDKCMGCVGNAIDLSSGAFEALGSLDAGRLPATWYFND